MDISGRILLVTGGAAGMGRAVAERFLRAGARVVLWDHDPQALAGAVRDLSAVGEVRGYDLDVTDRRKVRETAERVRREVGEVDLLDNNAGVVCGGDFLACPEEDLRRTVEVNLFAAMWCVREFLPAMIRRGSGRVIMMSSASGLLGVPGLAVYAATKHAIIGLAESLRLELKKAGCRGIGVTIVCPSFVQTGMFAGVKPPLLTPWLSPETVAEKIYQAVLKDRLYVREPFLVMLVPLLKGLAGAAVLDRVGEFLGMDRAMDTWTGHTAHCGPRAPERKQT